MNKYYFQVCYQLITESEKQTNQHLDDDVEHYIVQLTAVKFDDPTLGYHQPISLSRFNKCETTLEKYQQLKQTGDCCLLISSLTPFVAQKFGLSPSYFVSIGKSAFYELGKDLDPPTNIYTKIYQQFCNVRDVVENAFTHKMYSLEQLVVLGKLGSTFASNALKGTTLLKGIAVD